MNGGFIQCNNEQCPIKTLASFDIKEELLWKKNSIDYSNKLSKYVISGKYRTNSLKNSIMPLENNNSSITSRNIFN